MDRTDPLPRWISEARWRELLRAEVKLSPSALTLGGRVLRARGLAASITRAARHALRAHVERYGAGRMATAVHDVCALAWESCDALCAALEGGEALDDIEVVAMCGCIDDVESLAVALAAVVSDPAARDDDLALAADVRAELGATLRAIEARVAPSLDALRTAVSAAHAVAPAELDAVVWPGALPWWLDLFDRAPAASDWVAAPHATAPARRTSLFAAAPAMAATQGDRRLDLCATDGGALRVRVRIDDAGSIVATLLSPPEPVGDAPFALAWGDDATAVFTRERRTLTCHPARTLLEAPEVTLTQGDQQWSLALAPDDGA
jgi:hypothetical protein